jgi:hypothetical protein
VQRGAGDFFKAAWVMRNGVTEYATDINTLAMVLPDGLSTIGGYTQITLDSGEIINIEARRIDSIVTSSHTPNGGPGSTPAGVEALSRARAKGDNSGLEGFCDFNINVNPLNGQDSVTKLIFANADEGLTQRDLNAEAWAKRLVGWD